MFQKKYEQKLSPTKKEIYFVDIDKYVVVSKKYADKIAVLLGSCVSIIGYNPQEKKGFATHISNTKTAKEMIEELIIHYIKKEKKGYIFYLSGGNTTLNISTNIGKENLLITEEILAKHGIFIENKIHVGQKQGNKILLDLETGKIENIVLEKTNIPTQNILFS